MRAKVILIALILGVSTLPSHQAGSPEDLENVGWVFGGVYLDANALWKFNQRAIRFTCNC